MGRLKSLLDPETLERIRRACPLEISQGVTLIDPEACIRRALLELERGRPGTWFHEAARERGKRLLSALEPFTKEKTPGGGQGRGGEACGRAGSIPI